MHTQLTPNPKPRLAGLVAVAALVAGCGSPTPIRTVGAAVSAKPVRSYTIQSVSFLLTSVMTDLYLQLDQTGDSSHGATIQTFGDACVPATPAEKAACRASCIDNAGNDPNWLKRCTDACDALTDCTPGVCGGRFTYDYVHFGTPAVQKKCTSPSDSCPACTPGQQVSALTDVDLTPFIPSPVFGKTVDVIGPVSCWLDTFGVDLRTTNPNFNFGDWVSFDGASAAYYPYVFHVKAFASAPTVRCNAADLKMNLVNPSFDFRMAAVAVNHHATLDVEASFNAHVDYAASWIIDLDDTVAGKVNGALNGVLKRNADAINQQFEKLVFAKIKDATGDDIDDLRDIHFDGDNLVVQYTPLCVDGVCSCTPDCSSRSCGPDPHCGTECGPCKYGTCDANAGVCQCTPTVTSCAGLCGNVSDGCGHTLYCPPCSCTPSCAGKKCGASDGCRGTCYGYCKAKFSCEDDGGVKHCVYAGAD